MTLLPCQSMNEFSAGGGPDLCADVAAVLLAGGRSRRMGSDKALLPLEGIPLAQRIADCLHEVTDEVLLSAGDPSAYAFLQLPFVPDLFPDRGPVAGLHAAMLHTRRPWVLLLACDLPRISTAFLRHMIRQARGFDIVVPVTTDGCPHPVCAVYGRACLPALVRNLQAGDNRLISLLDEPGLQIRRWHVSDDNFSEADLFDIDRPQDLEAFLRMRKS
jgi:molybdopterin-guanine dinucleotide biosynthesis protein A